MSTPHPSLRCSAVVQVGGRKYTQRCPNDALPGLDRCKDCFLRLDSKRVRNVEAQA